MEENMATTPTSGDYHPATRQQHYLYSAFKSDNHDKTFIRLLSKEISAEESATETKALSKHIS
jgi:hypothetical protein